MTNPLKDYMENPLPLKEDRGATDERRKNEALEKWQKILDDATEKQDARRVRDAYVAMRKIRENQFD